MITGMLWFDNNKQTTLTSKIEEAAQYYRKKYGQSPDICFVHPQMIGGDEQAAPAKLEVKPSPMILLHHFWIGNKDNKDSQGT